MAGNQLNPMIIDISVIEMLVDQLLEFTDISELKTWLEDH